VFLSSIFNKNHSAQVETVDLEISDRMHPDSYFKLFVIIIQVHSLAFSPALVMLVRIRFVLERFG